MFRYPRLLASFARVSWHDLSAFRADFFTSVAHYLVYQAIFLLFWRAVLSFTADRLGDWTLPELMILSACTLMSMSVMLLFTGFLTLYQKILHGGLDKYLCRPISPLFGLLAEDMRLFAALQQAVAGLLIMVPVALTYHVSVRPLDVLAATALLAAGSLLVVLIQGCISTAAFWLGDVSRFQHFVAIMGDFEKYPINLFPRTLQLYLTWVMPVGLVSTFPVMVLLGKVRAGFYLGAALLLIGIWSAVFAALWRKALTRYESFGG